MAAYAWGSLDRMACVPCVLRSGVALAISPLTPPPGLLSSLLYLDLSTIMNSSNGKAKGSRGSWSVLLLVAESVFGFVWWSTFVEFMSTLWFFPLEKMDFSGLYFLV